MENLLGYIIGHLPGIALTLFLGAFAGRYIYLISEDEKNGREK